MITREKRDYVWIMSRTPTMSEADLKKLTDFVARQGYDVAEAAAGAAGQELIRRRDRPSRR